LILAVVAIVFSDSLLKEK
jgi:hypothetical protein